MKNKALLITNVVLLLVALVAITTYAFERGLPSGASASEGEAGRTLSINGSGQVTVEPDIAVITVGVRTTHEDAKEAVAANNAQTEQLIAALKTMGIAEEDIQTSNFSIYQMEDYSRPLNNDGMAPKVFSVDNNVTITVRDLPALGDTLTAAVDAGANSVYGISFDRADKTEAYKLARQLAVQNAKAQAEELAGLVGVTLGDVQTVSTYSSAPIVYPMAGAVEAAFDMAKAVPVSPGQLTITSDVSLVYTIK